MSKRWVIVAGVIALVFAGVLAGLGGLWFMLIHKSDSELFALSDQWDAQYELADTERWLVSTWLIDDKSDLQPQVNQMNGIVDRYNKQAKNLNASREKYSRQWVEIGIPPKPRIQELRHITIEDIKRKQRELSE